ncbi:MAG: hypothetical protein IAX22_04830 [Candidatus Bathyarchaeota archaeon]|nr:hypothetical protein [Candidatus Bathyarchaeota archaeon]
MKIPLEKIKEGRELSKKKCIDHLDVAELLASNGFTDNSVISLEFAIEEFGRIVAFNENLKNKSDEIDDRIMKNHEFKYNLAWGVLPKELKILYEGTFDPAIFDPEIFDCAKETISPQTRLNATFINWDNRTNDWKDTINVDAKKISEISIQIKKSLETMTFY